MYKICVICVLLLFCHQTKAQQVFSLEIIPPSNTPYQNTFQNKLERHQELRDYLSLLYDNGYLAASFDSLIEDSTMLFAYINPGGVYKWALLKKGNIDEGILSRVGFREKLYDNKPVNYKQVKKLHEKLLTYCENNGYPYASITLDSIKFSEFSIEAKLNLAKNKEF